MVSTSRVINIGLASLAGLAAIAWQPAQAQCNTTAWSTVTGAPVAGGPAQGVRIYQGACGLNPVNGAGASLVEEATRHAAEGGGGAPFIGRFFFYAGITGANPVVFRAFSADVAGTQVIQVTHNPTSQNVSFLVNGTTQSTANNTATNGKWVEVTFTYNASGTFTANTRSVSPTNVLTDIAGSITAINTGALTVERVQLGNVASGGGTGNTSIDEYEASRQVGGTPATALTRMCRGDVNATFGDIDVGDRAAVTAAIRGTFPAINRPDCNEDGAVDVGDRACVTALIRAFRNCGA
ncbi:MAG: hypothetical protein ACT4NL_10180 [Pseudomarimonas sp.]